MKKNLNMPKNGSKRPISAHYFFSMPEVNPEKRLPCCQQIHREGCFEFMDRGTNFDPN
jgi:hypothetical protein